MGQRKTAVADSRACVCGAHLGSARPVGALSLPRGGLVKPPDYMVCVDVRLGHIIKFVGVATMVASKVALGWSKFLFCHVLLYNLVKLLYASL